MYITHLTLRNWRNFREVEAPLRERTYLLGPNASGKSNLLDVFRFLRDVSKPEGGGLQKAVADRGGMKKLRCLHARKRSDVRIEVAFAQGPDESPIWQYVLGFKNEGKGRHRTLITEEHVRKNGEEVISRPTPEDKTDRYRLTQTYLEQIQMNAEFRELAESVAAELEIPFLGVDLLVTDDRVVVSETNARPTIDAATKYEPGFYDRLADAIRAAKK